MNDWFYARGGQQSGPVTLEQLSELARGGGLDAQRDLVWNASMPNWVPAGQVAGLFGVSAPDGPPPPPVDELAVPAAVGSDNPYAAPQAPVGLPTAPVLEPGGEIVPGSDPIVPTECVKRGFDLTKRHFPTILLVGVVYFAILFGLSALSEAVGVMVGGEGNVRFEEGVVIQSQTPSSPGGLAAYLVVQIVFQVVSIFLGLGLTRVGLNFVSGAPVTVGQLFGEGNKLLRAIGGSILFSLMVMVGLLLLIVPGIYLALRYGHYMTALVDKNMPLMEAFRYSSSLTTNNRMNLFVLAILGILITLAGLLACGVGLIFAGPVAWLSWIAAYRWMQFGRRAIQD